MRLRIDLAYDGGDFHGWAAQPGLRTVQGELEAALGTVLRMPAPAVVCAGRTDTGVHARGQVVHLDVEPDALTAAAGRYDGDPCDALARRLDGLLARRSPGTTGGRRTRRFRRPLLAAVAPLRLPGHRRRPRPAHPRPRAGLAAAARRRRTRRRPRPAARAPRLRGVLQAARGRDHGPDPARPRLGPRRRPADRHRPGRRVLPPHGALAGGLPARGGRGAAAGRVAGRGARR